MQIGGTSVKYEHDSALNSRRALRQGYTRTMFGAYRYPADNLRY